MSSQSKTDLIKVFSLNLVKILLLLLLGIFTLVVTGLTYCYDLVIKNLNQLSTSQTNVNQLSTSQTNMNSDVDIWDKIPRINYNLVMIVYKVTPTHLSGIHYNGGLINVDTLRQLVGKEVVTSEGLTTFETPVERSYANKNGYGGNFWVNGYKHWYFIETI
ncbi:putative orfan [Tupanvirus soda lake]|uniref:Orfan n=2 Tax=Tupanvirus TaxID=2094720 RepID=A0AC62ADD7_9VIRU|nr:putative orfan [Tupanvirus soda lake]QKU35792.1 putative orfan [Tupanvirus soda lake]